MQSLAEHKASARWCRTVRKSDTVQLSAAKLQQLPVSTFSERGGHVSLANNSRESRENTKESVRRVRFLSESGCSCGGAAHCRDDCTRRISLAALPLFNDALDWPRSHLLHLSTKQVLWEIDENFPIAEQQQAEHKKRIFEFVEAFTTAGILARHQRRWSKQRVCTLTMTADLKLTWSAAERKTRSSNMPLSHVVDVRREGRTVFFVSSKRSLCLHYCTAVQLDNELEAILLVCVLKAMVRPTTSSSCDSSTSTLTRHDSSRDASSSSFTSTSRRRWYRPKCAEFPSFAARMVCWLQQATLTGW
jgi:hypothetical protein